jgi:hypothetical protein
MISPADVAAQSPPQDCTAGDGFYTCTYKNKAGNVFPGSLDLSLSQNFSTFAAAISPATNATSLSFSGLCDCGVRGNVKNDDPLKDTKEVKCLGFGGGFDALLVGRVAGNPNKPATLKTKGQLHLFPPINSTFPSSGWVYDCKAAPQ